MRLFWTLVVAATVLLASDSSAGCLDNITKKLGIVAGTTKYQVAEGVWKAAKYKELSLAIAVVESGLNDAAVSHKGALGVMQITKIAHKEALRNQCYFMKTYKPELHRTWYNVRIANCYLDAIEEPAEGSLVKRLIYYNGGLRQLNRFETEGRIASETANYVTKVLYYLEVCKNG